MGYLNYGDDAAEASFRNSLIAAVSRDPASSVKPASGLVVLPIIRHVLAWGPVTNGLRPAEAEPAIAPLLRTAAS